MTGWQPEAPVGFIDGPARSFRGALPRYSPYLSVRYLVRSDSKLAVVGVDGGAKGGFGGTTLADTLQDPLNVAHAVGIVDVGDGSQGFGVGDIGLRP